jgi:AAA15 family ATPase/GTPase
MIKSLKIENFRCFDKLSLSDFRRVNIIVGQNAAGKTALLEAIRLALGGTPQVAIALNSNRGIPFVGIAQSRDQFEALWNPLFYKYEANRTISTEVNDSEGHSATLKISYDPSKSVTPTQTVQPNSAPSTIIPIKFDRSSFAGELSTLYGTVHAQGQGQLNLEGGPELGLAIEFFASSWLLNSQQNAQWFSQLSLENREHEVVNAVKKEFDPMITDMQVLSLTQFMPGAVYATVPFIQSKIPLSLLSAGITKFFTILAAILYRRHGVVLIDEIENGLYYGRLRALWQTLLRLAKENDTQLFVSTHSYECLQALLPMIAGNEEDFALLRAERSNGSSKISQFSGKDFEAALAIRGEVR